MSMFSKKNVKDIPVEATLHTTGSRKLLVAPSEMTAPSFEAFTYGYLPIGETWEEHMHDNITEICIVIVGSGIIRDSYGSEEVFVPGDRFIFPPNVGHEISNTSNEIAEFYFIRIKSL